MKLKCLFQIFAANLLLAAVTLPACAAGQPVPVNDLFLDQIPLTGASLHVTGSNVGASYEPGEPYPGQAKTVWWSWTAPANGLVTIDTFGSSFDTVLAVYLGTRVNALSNVTRNDNTDDPISRQSRVRFPVTANRVYRIAVDAIGAAGNIALNIEFTADPSVASLNLPAPASVENDQLKDRIKLSGTNVAAIGYNMDASYEPSEPYPAVAKTLWWGWTSPGTGVVKITTEGSTTLDGLPMDTVIAAYLGDSIANIFRLALNDDAPGENRYSAVSFPVTAGQEYLVQVDIKDVANRGSVVLKIAFATEPFISSLNLQHPVTVTNDLFRDRVLLTGPTVSAIGNTTDASYEAGEPYQGVAKTAWWRWIAETDQEVAISTTGSSFDTVLAVFSGSAVNALKLVAKNDNENEDVKTSLVRFIPKVGETYQIMVDGFDRGQYGVVVLNLRQAFAVLGTEQISIDQAVELTFNTVAGTTYQLERSVDLVAWTADGEPFVGKGGEEHLLVSTAHRARANYRFVGRRP